jgi:hypothetical protein
MDPEEHESDLHRGPTGCGLLVGLVFGAIVWWSVYKFVAALVE